MRRIKPFLVLVLLVIVVYLLGGVYYASYSPEVSDAYRWGAWHVHSTFSDGLYSLPEIAEEARKSRVDFVLLTDHGRPNRQTSTLDETVGGVRFIGGSESGIPEGHINFFGAKEIPLFNLPPYPPDAFDDIREWGGFGVLTYPEDPRDPWRYWERDLNPDGIEIINITSYFRRASVWGMLATAIFAPFSDYHFLKDITPPAVALSRWDELLGWRKVLGFYASNAHGGFPIAPESRWTVPIPSYKAAFSLVGLGVDPGYGGDVEQAIREGAFFSVLRGAGEPKIFDFHAELDGRILPAGSAVSGSPELVVQVTTEHLTPRVVLKRNGQPVVNESSSGAPLRFKADSPGAYRAEVYLDGHRFLSPEVPWILSNPIFVDPDFEERDPSHFVGDERVPIPLDELRVERDEESTTTFVPTDDGYRLTYHLSEATEEKIDRWVALALRKPMDLSRFEGVYLDADSSDYMRYQIEIRSGDRIFYSSAKLYPGRENHVIVPFSKFYETFDGRAAIPLDAVDSFFLTVNTSSTKTGFSSELTLHALGFCR